LFKNLEKGSLKGVSLGQQKTSISEVWGDHIEKRGIREKTCICREGFPD